MEYKRFQRMNYTFKNAEEARRVLGIEGTDPSEVFSLTFFVPLCSLLVWLITSITSISNKAIQLLELCLLNIIMLMAVTLFEDHLQVVLGILVFLIFVLLYISVLINSANKEIKYVLKDVSVPKRNINKDFVTGYRGHLLLATATSILAVDFNFFPVRFAKTETYGWSMMDAGVGSFILLQGLCSSHGKSLTAQHSLKKCFMSSFPIFLIGFIRLVTTTAVGYHKVVPEYGVHWNFFFTFALTKMICYTILYAVKLPSGLLAIVTVAIHQLILSKAGLATLIVSETRRNFFEANKEGIGSLLGFVTLYFSGVQLGKIVWKQGYKISDYIKLLLKLCAIGAAGWILMYMFHFTLQPVSRRMANLPYCIWVLALMAAIGERLPTT
ncbi:hypothetical protein HNY73_016548 [Argiope bruennichi]|uniref:Phosphatidylinositol-glycan biosynthesis class W protein n=1 Tax=Argiope bruennichi TaxID=94029 RepID=A0A8T0EJ53_ARGBR|nr:hypothetical protein HNY73_016548 [Argiope bruennichi]